MKITYRIKTASMDDVYSHLMECDGQFIPCLSKRVDIREYSKKLYERSVTFEAWDKTALAGLLCAYFNDPKGKSGFITSVSVLPSVAGKGIASKLVEDCLGYAREHSFLFVGLEVSKKNSRALKLYEKKGFVTKETAGDIVHMGYEFFKKQDGK